MITCKNIACVYCFEGDCQLTHVSINKRGLCACAESKKEAAFIQKGSPGNLEDELYAELLERTTFDKTI